ncbi:MAG: DUF2997 domain-containing protein [Proteobacteria bacterium]|nr:DUF2997 domain-containing protein [Pseudomonadota bacterium]
MDEVKVTIDEQGNVKVTVFGVQGPGCLEVTRKIEALLGGQVEREFTSEYYSQTEEVKETQTVRKG